MMEDLELKAIKELPPRAKSENGRKQNEKLDRGLKVLFGTQVVVVVFVLLVSTINMFLLVSRQQTIDTLQADVISILHRVQLLDGTNCKATIGTSATNRRDTKEIINNTKAILAGVDNLYIAIKEHVQAAVENITVQTDDLNRTRTAQQQPIDTIPVLSRAIMERDKDITNIKEMLTHSAQSTIACIDLNNKSSAHTLNQNRAVSRIGDMMNTFVEALQDHSSAVAQHLDHLDRKTVVMENTLEQIVIKQANTFGDIHALIYRSNAFVNMTTYLLEIARRQEALEEQIHLLHINSKISVENIVNNGVVNATKYIMRILNDSLLLSQNNIRRRQRKIENKLDSARDSLEFIVDRQSNSRSGNFPETSDKFRSILTEMEKVQQKLTSMEKVLQKQTSMEKVLQKLTSMENSTEVIKQQIMQNFQVCQIPVTQDDISIDGSG